MLSACSSKDKCEKIKDEKRLVINFDDSVTIIRELLKSDSLTQILDDHDPEKLDFLINNFSPAEIAFESEVSECTLPVVIYFYEQKNDVLEWVEYLALKYQNAIKVLLINGNNFPQITNNVEITEYPTVLVIKDKREIARLSKQAINSQNIENIIEQIK